MSDTPFHDQEHPGAFEQQRPATDPGHPRLPYMPGIDALRAIAVLAVFAYHTNASWLPGGFLGVDVFFVISGYLITSLLLDERLRSGHVDVLRFWLRRARRLLPAVGVMIAVTLVAAALFARDGFLGMRGDALASLLYVNNWHQIFSDQSYFEEFARPSLFRHLWSLSVEEQFYLLWPLLFAAGIALLGRRRLVLGVAAAAVASTVLMALLFDPHGDPSRVFFGADTRATPLLVGVALALVWRPTSLPPTRGRWAPAALDAVGALALVAVIAQLVTVNEFDLGLYRGGFLLCALASGLLVAALAHPSARIGRILGNPPMVWLGVRSYSFYLWHWPVLMLTRPEVDVPLEGTALRLLQLAATILLADLSYRYVEQPFRRGAGMPRLPSGRVFGRPALAAAVVAVVAIVGWSGVVPKPEISAEERALAAAQARIEQIEAARPDELSNENGILAIGDSVMVGATPALHNALGPELSVTSEVGMQQDEVVGLAEGFKAAGTLPPIVIIHMGNNGPLLGDEMEQLREALAEVKQVFFVNVEVPRSWEPESNRVLTDAAESWDNADLLDWNQVANSRDDLLFDDGIHLKPPGIRAYTTLITSAVLEAQRALGV